jgi:GNAT superfamily N-acetyltransferase
VIRRSPNPFKLADDFGLIDQISVEPKARRQGLAHTLVEAARQFLRDQGITRMRADHWAFNKRAAAFFSSEGLEPLRVNSDGPVDR